MQQGGLCNELHPPESQLWQNKWSEGGGEGVEGCIGQRKVCKTRYCGHQPPTITGASCYSKAVSAATEVM